MYKIKKENLSALFRLIKSEQELIVPLKNGNVVNFGVWDESQEVDLKTLKTVKSPKDAFFPQSENLYTVIKENRKMKIQPEAIKDQPFVLFGIKGCDIKGIEVLDRVFLAEPVDTYYAARRAGATLVALACHEPEESCFCNVFGVDCTAPAGDVVTWFFNDELYWKPITEKGLKLTEMVSSVLFECTEGNQKIIEDEKKAVKEIVGKLPYSNLSLEGWNEASLNKIFDSSLWEELVKPCLACGTCTFVCPTCQCYDIKDYNTGKGVLRYRCWDSCMYSDFTMMAHGNNRTTQMQRFRQRFMHKLVYYPANNDGLYSCVGCGRCIEKCPSSLNIVKVVKAFEKEGGINHE